MKGLNLSKFKKVSSDRGCTTLRHADGHELKIAHGSLSPKMREELGRLPVHKAEGGDTAPEFEPGKDYSKEPLPADQNASQAPVVINVGNQPESGAMPKGPDVGSDLAKLGAAIAPLLANRTSIPKSVQQDPGMAPGLAPWQGQQPAASETLAPAAEAPSPAAQPQPASLPQEQPMAAAPPATAKEQVAAQVQKPGVTGIAEQPQEVIKRDLTKEDQAWQNDLNNGHITPQTYKSLFAEKDTLGKIGTIFGLLVSGAGAGLTHQPNALLEMMNKEIERDLEAQKNSKANAQNFVRLSQQQVMQDAQIKQMMQQGKLTEAQANQLGYAMGQSKILQSSYHDLVQLTNRMPEGPQKELAKQQLGTVYRAISDKITNINDLAAGASAFSGAGTAGQGAEGQLNAQLQNLRVVDPERAKEIESRYIPSIGIAKVPLSDGDRKAVEGLSNFQNILKEAKELDARVGRVGAWTPSDRADAGRIRADLISSYNDVKNLNRFTKNEENLYESVIAPLGDSNFTGSVKHSLEQLDKTVSTKQQLRYKQLGIQPFGGGQSRPVASEQTSPQIKTVNGIQYKRGPKGEAIRVN